MRFLGLLKADESSEAGAPPTPEMMERMGMFMQEVAAAGVLQASDGLQPSSKGKRVRVDHGKTTVIDGPFTESKELVASYAIFDVKSIDEAVYWTTRFLQVLGTGQCELRPIFEATDFPPEAYAAGAPHEEAAREQMKKNAARG